MSIEWWEALIGGGTLGSVGATVVNKILSRRKDRADVGAAEAGAYAAWQHAAAEAGAEMEKARQNSETWYAALQAVRAETDARIEAATAGLKAQNAELSAAVAVMARQLDQRTVDEAEVALARRTLARNDQLELENTALREQASEIPRLRQEVADLRIEVAGLRSQLADAQREQRLDHEILRGQINEGEAP